MKVCFCHSTALHLLRLWSIKHAVSLSDFHRLRPRDTRHLPSRQLRTSSSVNDCVASERDLEGLIADAKGSPAGLFLSQLLDEVSSSGPLRLLIHRTEGKRRTNRVSFHQVTAPLPRGALLQFAPAFYVSSPELLFVQAAACLSFGELIALGYELCGCYPVPSPSKLVRAQLTTPLQIELFIKHAKRLRGLLPAKTAVRYLRAKSASPMETEVSALLTLPAKWGGYGLPPALLNEPVKLSSQASRIARSTHLVLDAFWDEKKVAVEYDGEEAHGSRMARVRDSRRNDALAVDNISHTSITSPQFHSINEFQEIALHLKEDLGLRHRGFDDAFLERHLALRNQLKKFHRGDSF